MLIDKNAFEYILAGASAVQIGTQFVREKYGVFDRIKRYNGKKGYDFRGGLKI